MVRTKLGKDYCPGCGKLLDAATPLDGEAVPSPGDITVCLYCSELLLYSDDMSLVKLPPVIYESLTQEIKGQLAVAKKAVEEIRTKINGRTSENK